MKQILLLACCVLFSGFLSAQQKQQNLENSLKTDTKIESYLMNQERQTPSSIKIKPNYSLTIENLPGFLKNTLQINNDAFQFKITDVSKSKIGSEIITFSATYNDVNIAHARYKAFVKEGEVKFVTLEHYNIEQSMNAPVTLSKEHARNKATQHVGADKYVWDVITEQMAKTFDANALSSLEASYVEHFPVGELVYVNDYSSYKAKLKLAYKFNIYASEPVYRANVFVDAQSGKILLADAVIKHANEINEKRDEAKKVVSYAPYFVQASGDTRFAGNRTFETTLSTFTSDAPLGGSVTAYSLDGTINLSSYGVVDDPATPADESLVLNETRSYDGVGGAPVNVNGIPSYSIYDGYSRSAEAQTVAEISDNNWSSAEHLRNDFSLSYPTHNEKKNDDVALDAHWGAEIVVRYWAEKHGRSSHDNKGTKILNYVHFGDAYDNAFWNGTAMTYGDGSYQGGGNPNGSFLPLTSLDVCGHEIGHGVCSATADLVYARESGAMNEGFSDIWAAAVENYVIQIGGTVPPYDPWGIGEQIDERDGGLAPGSADSRALRWMDDPNAAGNPSCYGGSDWAEPECGEPTLANDQCGVHNNSGVLNKWFYLLVTGSGQTLSPGKDKAVVDPSTQDGVDNPGGEAYSVTGLGYAIAEQITFQAELLLTPNAKFEEMRKATLLIAEMNYTSAEVEQVTNAWHAVCVGEKYVTPDANVLLYEASSASLVNEATTTNGCNEVKTITVSITAATVTTAQTANFTFSDSTASLGEDFDISPSSLTFPVSATSNTQQVTVTIYNDAIIEGTEKIQMDFPNDTGIRKHTITIMDDDYVPIVGSGTVELLNETFDVSTTPTGWFVNSEFDANTWLFNGTGPTSTGRAYVVPNLSNTPEPTYDGTVFSSIHLISKPVDARGISNVTVKFDYEAGGENDQTALFDWGEFMYSFDGATYESVEKFATDGSPGGLGPNKVGTFNMVMPALDNKAFTLIWRWYNDSIAAGPYSFSIDNILVTGQAAAVEGDLANSDSETVKTGNQIYFISDQDGGVLGIIENASVDLGCVTLNVEEVGITASYSNITGKHSGKVFKIEADGANASTATYDVTLYFTDAELTGFTDPGALKIIKVSGAIDDASDGSGNYIIAGSLLETNAAQQYRTYKANFTGFSTFALHEPNTLSNTEFETSEFQIYPTLISNNENITVKSVANLIETTSIYSITGALIHTEKVNTNNASVSTVNLAAGMYFLVINKNNTFKFIIK
ncbi:M4 family metallopeptidase [Lacinutrix sp. Bg11-31]|uniref:M4 family metallopeptidase n=1 Tax=Lacinutrix sp. Bg11-31 TaxID=2057808 RepID=UPI000C3167B4|nr:M4 family metallopeptidase [Lacinutrix sp. Bg11-31]AUC82302.1 peptidase [Lacinutrix sp. Bg11-31]